MARRGQKKSPKKRWTDPGQLGLFDTAEKRDAQRATPRPATQKSSNAKGSKTTLVDRPVVLSPREAARYLGISESTLKNWRVKKIGPAWRKRGARLIAYFPADLDGFLRANDKIRTPR